MQTLLKHLIKATLTTMLLLTSGISFSKGLSVDEPYVREVPPGQTISASFMTLKNDTESEIALIKASSDVAKTVELHEHVHEDGMMKMRQVPKIIIPANGTTVLKPGGYHIMLIGLQRKIKAGDKVELALEFNNGTKETITATVRKIMMGMMKGGMHGKKMGNNAKMNALKKHTNPMPNLMKVYMKMGDKLNLTEEQARKLKAGIAERGPKIKELTAAVAKIEADINNAAFNDEPIEKIEQLANKLMNKRLSIIKGKTYCRESVKKILDKKQYAKMVELYRANFMPKSEMNEMQKKMAMKKHTNPMPNLMMVTKKINDKLNLSEDQAAKLKLWSDSRGPMMKKNYKAVMSLEAELKEAALNNEPTEKLAPIADAIMQTRLKIIHGKAQCRDNMKSILDEKQYALTKKLYKGNPE